jgi:uncharacterized protein YqeY
MIEETLRKDLVLAMKEKDATKVLTLRSLLATLTKEKIAQQQDRNTPLPDTIEQKLLRTELKKRHEAREAYESAGRSEQAASEGVEAEIIGQYLPAELSDDELHNIIQKIKEEHPDANTGILMREVMAVVAGRAQGKRVKDAIEKS